MDANNDASYQSKKNGTSDAASLPCIGCNGLANYSFFLILITSRHTPRLRKNTHAHGICEGCLNPHSEGYQKIKVILGALLFDTRNALAMLKAESIPDFKKAAAGE